MVLLKVALTVFTAASLAVSGSAYNLPHNLREVTSPNPPAENLKPLPTGHPAHERRITNAQRMRRGLAPNKPLFRKRPTPVRRDEPSSTPTPSPAPLCTGRSGVIRAHAGSPSSSDPWLSKSMNAFGEYGTTTSLDNALTVTLCGNSGAFSIWATNSPISDLPFLGGISGVVNPNDNMSPSAYNYAYIGSTVKTADDSPAVSGDNSFSRATGNSPNVESSVWSIGSDDSLTTSWVNSNGARVNGVIVNVVSGTDDSFVFTAGYSSYVDQFGPSPIWNFSFEEL